MALANPYLASTVAIMKELYTDQQVDMLDYEQFPWLTMVDRDESAYDGLAGKYKPVPLTYGEPAIFGHNFANALATSGNAQNISFQLPLIEDFGVLRINNTEAKAAAGNAGAFVSLVKRNADAAMLGMKRRMALEALRSRAYFQGSIAASGGLVTLADPTDIMYVVVGTKLDMFTLSGTTTSQLGAAAYVVSVASRINGTFYVSATAGGSAATPASWTGSGYFCVDGDLVFGANGLSVANQFSGLGIGQYVGVVPSPGENFLGVDRSVDATRLAGLAVDGTGKDVKEALIDAMTQAYQNSIYPDMILINPTSNGYLTKGQEASSFVTQIPHPKYDIAFPGFNIQAPWGLVPVVADPSVPLRTAYALTSDTFKICSLGRAPQILTYEGEDGIQALRDPNQNAIQFRLWAGWNTECSAPGRNVLITFSV